MSVSLAPGFVNPKIKKGRQKRLTADLLRGDKVARYILYPRSNAFSLTEASFSGMHARSAAFIPS